MIADFKTNTVYIADSTPRAYKTRLEKIGIMPKVLYGTEDYYCRDYMPVQIAEKEFVQFVYRPGEYIAKDDYKRISNPTRVELETGLFSTLGQFKYSRIIMDGGNVVRAEDKVIISDKVIEDNLLQFDNNKVAIQTELEKTLNCQVIIIPRYPRERTGHADGLVRFIDNSTVIVNMEDENDPKDWLNKFYGTFNLHNIEIKSFVTCAVKPEEMEKPKGKENANGLYINFLQTCDAIVVPQFYDPKNDPIAFDQLKDAFNKSQSYSIKKMYAGDIAKYGGVLNCATWTIYQPKL